MKCRPIILLLLCLSCAVTPRCSGQLWGSDGQGSVARFSKYSVRPPHDSVSIGGTVVDIAVEAAGWDPEGGVSDYSILIWYSNGSGIVWAYDYFEESPTGLGVAVNSFSQSIAIESGWRQQSYQQRLLWGSNGSGQVQAFDIETGLQVGPLLNVGAFSHAIAVGSRYRYGSGADDFVLWGSDGTGQVQAFDPMTGNTVGPAIFLGAYAVDIAMDGDLYLWGTDGDRVARVSTATSGPSAKVSLGAFGGSIDFPRDYLPEPTASALLVTGSIVLLASRRKRGTGWRL